MKTSYTLEEVAKHNKRNDCWIILYENVYDITKFMKYHSGKYFPLQLAGKDGTELFESIHPKRAKVILNSAGFKKKYYKGKLIRNKRKLSNRFQFNSDFGKTLNERVENYFESVKNTHKARGGRNEKSYVFFKFFLLSTLIIIFKYKQLKTDKSLYSVFYGFSVMLVLFNISHGANHGELIKRYPNWFSWICEKYHILVGQSDYAWKQVHHVGHHQHTNTKQDYDSRYPINNKTEIGLQRLHRSHKYIWFHKYQHFYSWFLYIGAQISYFVLGEKLTPFVAIYLVYIIILSKFISIKSILLEIMTIGIIHPLINNITHTNDMVEYNDISNGCWYKHQLKTTANWSCNNMFITQLLGGINHQIEHHLFQSVHHYHYPAIRKIVKQTCKEKDVPYHEFPNYLSALYSHYKLLKKYSTP